MKAPFGENVYLDPVQGNECRLYGCSLPAQWPVDYEGRRIAFCEKHSTQFNEGEIVVSGFVKRF